MRSMTADASQPNNRNACIFNTLLSFRSEKGDIADKLLTVEFLLGNGYTSKTDYKATRRGFDFCFFGFGHRSNGFECGTTEIRLD